MNHELAKQIALESEKSIGTLVPDDPATNEEIEKMINDRQLKILKEIERKSIEEINHTYDEAYNEGFKEGFAQYQLVLNGLMVNNPTFKGWIAKDEDGSLRFHYKKPERMKLGKVWNSNVRSFELHDVKLPNLKFENGPQEVEIIIRAK